MSQGEVSAGVSRRELVEARRRRRRRTTVAMGTIVAAIIGGGVALFLLSRSGGSDDVGAPGDQSAEVQPPSTVGELSMSIADGQPVIAGPLATVRLELPDWVSEVEVTTDPTFATATARGPVDEVEVEFLDAGYQMVFGRFRDGTGERQVSLVAGVHVDPTREAALASVDGLHRASYVGLVAPNIVVVRVEEGRLRDVGTGWVVDGESLDAAALDRPASYALSGAEGESEPAAVHRVARPLGSTEIDDRHLAPLEHDIYLVFDEALGAGEPYDLDLERAGIENVSFVNDDRALYSPAVHVNQVGYLPSDRPKQAFLSTWMGDGGGVPRSAGIGFAVLDISTGAVVAQGASTTAPSGDELDRGDLTGAPVQVLDFSDVSAPGRYAVCVDDIGCSSPVLIGDNTWARVASALGRAAYHQRSGIELGAPYTAVSRPRAHHPDDGRMVRASNQSLSENFNGLGDGAIGAIADSATDEVVENAWGGYMDAGDWDRRAQHVALSLSAIHLVDLYPEVYESLDLNIPESGDAVPDLLDEARWMIDFNMRLQGSDGSVRGGIESSEHPARGSTSWTDRLPLYTYAPDRFASYLHVAGASELARVLAKYDPVAADEYATSAVAAMEWAEAEEPGAYADEVTPYRAAAAAALFSLTGDARWNAVVLESAGFVDGPQSPLNCRSGPHCDAAWYYARADQPGIDGDVQANAVESLIRNAEEALGGSSSTSFGWTLEHPHVPLVWGLGPSSPKGVGLLRAYVVTGEERFRNAAVQAASFSVGANPMNFSFITGIGDANPRRPLIVDTLNGGLPIWPGTPIFGLHDLNRAPDDDWFENFRLDPLNAQPLPPDVPYLESFWDVGSFAGMAEFTIHQQLAPALFVYGALAAGSAG